VGAPGAEATALRVAKMYEGAAIGGEEMQIPHP